METLSGANSNARKLFCLDFEDTANNTTTKVTDIVRGVELTKPAAGSIEFLDNYNGFGRVLRCNTRSAANVYETAWSNVAANFPANFSKGQPYSIAFFANMKGGPGSSNRSGLLAAYNTGQLTGWQDGPAYFIGVPTGPLGYSGSDPTNDLSLFVYG